MIFCKGDCVELISDYGELPAGSKGVVKDTFNDSCKVEFVEEIKSKAYNCYLVSEDLLEFYFEESTEPSFSYGDILEFILPHSVIIKGKEINISIGDKASFAYKSSPNPTVKVNNEYIQVPIAKVKLYKKQEEMFKIGAVVTFWSMGKKTKGVIEDCSNMDNIKVRISHNSFCFFPKTRLTITLPFLKNCSYTAPTTLGKVLKSTSMI